MFVLPHQEVTKETPVVQQSGPTETAPQLICMVTLLQVATLPALVAKLSRRGHLVRG